MKEGLLSAIDQGRELEAELEAFVVDEPAKPDGSWTAKDHLAHVTWWRMRTVQTLDAVRTGAELPPPVPDDDDGVQNAIVYEKVKDRPAADVQAEAAHSWTALRKAIEASSEDDLAKQHPRQTESQVWEAVPGAVGHAASHVMSWYFDVGDEKRAMAAAQWGSRLEGKFFTKPEQLADSRYNLACAHARLGNAAEAVPLLHQSFEVRPALKAWARKDRDLDSIRQDPRVVALLTDT